MARWSGRQVREACRAGTFTGPTAGVARGYAQMNLVVLRASVTDDFVKYCHRNPKPCPLLEATPAGDYELATLAPGADLRTDLPRYRVFREGKLEAAPTSVVDWWREDMVAFLIGCSFTFEAALQEQNIPVRHIEEHRNVPMYRTSIATEPAGVFGGPLVVSMRPMTPAQSEEARRVTAEYPRVHGAPLHVGDPKVLGIADLARPDFGDPVTIHPGEVPVFWACGVTPMEAVLRACLDLAITHEPGHMLVTDWKDRNLRGRGGCTL